MPSSNRAVAVVLLSLLCAVPASDAAPLSGDDIRMRVLDIDTFGLSGAEVEATLTVKDKKGDLRELKFNGRSSRYSGHLSKALFRFSAPSDFSGVAFLQIQKKEGDDERHLFLPELKKSKRVAGNMRSQAFMGTDFNYADLDFRDLREGNVILKGEPVLGEFPCYLLSVEPGPQAQSPYQRIELWVRKDNFVPLQSLMYGKSGTLMKTLQTQQMQRLKGRWFITRSLMTNHPDQRQSELVLSKIQPREDIQDTEFTVRNLERL